MVLMTQSTVFILLIFCLLGDQVDHVIPIRLSTVRVEEFEVYIREVTGAAYVSINLPKCKAELEIQ